MVINYFIYYLNIIIICAYFVSYETSLNLFKLREKSLVEFSSSDVCVIRIILFIADVRCVEWNG